MSFILKPCKLLKLGELINNKDNKLQFLDSIVSTQTFCISGKCTRFKILCYSGLDLAICVTASKKMKVNYFSNIWYSNLGLFNKYLLYSQIENHFLFLIQQDFVQKSSVHSKRITFLGTKQNRSSSPSTVPLHCTHL